MEIESMLQYAKLPDEDKVQYLESIKTGVDINLNSEVNEIELVELNTPITHCHRVRGWRFGRPNTGDIVNFMNLGRKYKAMLLFVSHANDPNDLYFGYIQLLKNTN